MRTIHGLPIEAPVNAFDFSNISEEDLIGKALGETYNFKAEHDMEKGRIVSVVAGKGIGIYVHYVLMGTEVDEGSFPIGVTTHKCKKGESVSICTHGVCTVIVSNNSTNLKAGSLVSSWTDGMARVDSEGIDNQGRVGCSLMAGGVSKGDELLVFFHPWYQAY